MNKILALSVSWAILLLCSGVAHCATANSSEGRFVGIEARVAAIPSVQPAIERLSPDGRASYLRIVHLSEELQRMPSRAEFLGSLRDSPERFSRNDFETLFWIFRRLQRPKISKQELLAVIQAWDHDLRTIDLRYSVKVEGVGVYAGSSRKCRFAFSGSKILWDNTDERAANGKSLSRELYGYDGETLRHAQAFGVENIAAWNRGVHVIGRVQPLDTLSKFIDSENPVILQRIINPVRRYGWHGDEAFEDAVKDSVVFETPETFNDIECVCVGHEVSCYYLAPQYGFAVTGVRRGYFDFNADVGRVTVDNRYEDQVSEDFHRIDAAFWFPKRVLHRRLNGAENQLIEVSVDKCEINGDLDEASFSDIIPVRALVTEPSRPEAHRLVSVDEIEGDLESRMEGGSRKVGWIVIGNLVAICCVALVVFFRRRRADRVVQTPGSVDE